MKDWKSEWMHQRSLSTECPRIHIRKYKSFKAIRNCILIISNNVAVTKGVVKVKRKRRIVPWKNFITHTTL